MTFSGLLLAAGISIGATASALAHSAHGEDYTRFLTQAGLSCCNDSDCRPVDYRIRDGILVMFPEGREVVVDGSRVNPKTSHDGRAHWCGKITVMGGHAAVMTFCAILPDHGA